MAELATGPTISGTSRKAHAPHATTAIWTVIFLVIGIACVFPFVYMISTSFKLNASVFEYPFRLVPQPAVVNGYRTLFQGGSMFGRWYLNTIVLVVVTCAIRIVVVGITAYALAVLRFRGRNVIFMVFLATLMIPGDALMVPRYILMTELRLTNSMWAIVLQYTFEFFLVFMVRQFYLSIPRELVEAALIDGCNHVTVFFRIVLPLSKPAMITMILFTFVWQWNDFVSPFIFITDTDKQMLSVGISTFASAHTIDYVSQMAGATLILLPLIVVFLFVQKYFVQGIATSGIKG